MSTLAQNRIFVTGGTGLVGSYIVAELMEKGYQVKVLVRDPNHMGLLKNFPDRLNIVQGEISDISLLASEINNCDTVIHCAAIVSYAPNRFLEMYQTNVEGTKNIVNECVLSNKKLIHISSVAAIGSSNNNVISENEKWNDSAVNTFYSKTKHLSELEVWRGVEEGLRAVILNPSVVLGKGDIEKSSTKLFGYVRKGGKYYTEGNLNYVDVRDVAHIVSKALATENCFGKRYILNAGTTTFKVFFEKVAKILDVAAPSVKVNNFTAGIAWRLAYLKYLLTGKEPLITKETTRSSKLMKIYDNTLVSKDFDYKFKNLDETLAWCCEKNL